MTIHNIVLLAQHDCLTCSLEKENQIEITSAYDLGVLQQGFHSGTFDKNLFENLNETHFIINMDNDYTLGFYGHGSLQYVDVVVQRMP